MVRAVIGLSCSLISLVACASSSSAGVDCVYMAKQTVDNPHPELQGHRECGDIVDDRLILRSAHLDQLAFDYRDIGLAFVMANGKAFYVDPAGKTVRTVVYDSGPDYFEEGLARGIVDGRIGYFDSTLEFVIPPRFDFAYPFRKGHAIVCDGCEEVQVGEHRTSVGGRWGVIDRSGRAVIPLTHDKDGLKASEEFRRLGLD